MSRPEIETCLAGPHQAVLSVSRRDKGPVAVPMSYVFEDGRFWMITSPESRHGELMRRTGRITLTVHHEEYPRRTSRQWYVMAEGPVLFTDDDPMPLLRRLLAKDRTEELADEWVEQMGAHGDVVAVMSPDTLAGYRFERELP